MKKLLFLALFVNSLYSFGQSGTIQFEKSVNTYALIKKMLGPNPSGLDQQKFEQYQKTQTQFKVLKSTLAFNGNTSLYTPSLAEVNTFPLFTIPMAEQNNIVYTDLPKHQRITQKQVYEQTFLIKDSLAKINWKITGETREIAGYTCRRANAIVLDSVYVVAFYADDIHFSGGPEWFGGLPGMILELALPHDNVIWRAVSVNEAQVTVPPAPAKGKPASPKELLELFKNKNGLDLKGFLF